MKQSIYVGNTSENGIYCYQFQKGKLTQKNSTNDFERCTYIACNKEYLYSTIEVCDKANNNEGYILSYKKCSDKLINLGKSSAYGQGPCHIELSKDGKLLYVSNYIDGYLNIFNVNKDYTIGSKIYSYVEEKNKSHLHCVKESTDGKFFFVSDLGADMIIAYEIKDKEPKKVSEIKFRKGTQPRHIAVTKNRVYVITEKTCQLYIFEFKNKTLNMLDAVSILPKGTQKVDNYTGCAIKISKDFKYIYVTVRGHNTVSVYKIKNKTIKMIQNISSEGEEPRDLEIDNTQKYIFVANQNSNQVAIFKRNLLTGKIKYKWKEQMESPTCILSK